MLHKACVYHRADCISIACTKVPAPCGQRSGSMSNLPVSVALATFNGEKFLREQLHTLATQKVKPAELVACDDGSTDRTIAILQEFARTAPFPVRIIENTERLQYKANFMQAASLCVAPLIAFCDQDDIWHADKIDALGQAFK